MADFKGELQHLPPGERLKRLKELEEEKREKLEEKRRELEKAEQETKKELEETSALEKETEEELTEEEHHHELEERISHFRQGKEFIKQGIEETVEGAGKLQGGMYNAAFREAEQNISYLLSGQASREAEEKTQQGLYQSVTNVIEQAQNGADESYAISKLYQEIQQLRDNSLGNNEYLHHMQTVLKSAVENITDYKPRRI